MGVDIRCDSPVERLTFSGKTADGVVVGGKRFAHEHVVVNADASWAIKNLIPAELRTGVPGLPTAIGGGGWTDKRLDGMGYSCSTFMLYLGLAGQVSMPHHTIYISERYKDNLSDISDRGVLSTDPSIYVCNTAATDSTMAPAGHTALYVLVPTPNMRDGKVDWAAATAKLREQALDRVSTLANADVRKMIRAERVYTPVTWQEQNINFGATFNLAHNLTQMLMLRPQHELAGMHNVWMAGGGTHPGSGLPVIFLSCQIAAGKILQRMGAAGADCTFSSTPVAMGGGLRQAEVAFPRRGKVAAGV
jgi:phytoene desaturase